MISIISLLLELFFSQIIPKNLYLIPLFTLVSILFLKKNNKYYIFLFILGFIYDLFFTEVIFLHSIIFILIGLINKRNILILILIIVIYQIIIYISYSILDIIDVDIKEFIFISIHYYVINIIYYFILSIIYKNKS